LYNDTQIPRAHEALLLTNVLAAEYHQAIMSYGTRSYKCT